MPGTVAPGASEGDRALRGRRRRLATWMPALSILGGLVAAGCTESAPTPSSSTGAGSGSGAGGQGGGAGPSDWPLADPPTAIVIEDGVRRELVVLPGAPAPPNPTGSVATPAELNTVRFVRYREDASPPRPARAVLIAMPGLFLGAGSFEPLAAALVRRGAKSGEAVEVWAVERRANALEDHRGLHAAEAQQNPEIARRYYYGEDTVGGAVFAGFKPQSEVAFVSEWGLALHASDLRRIVHLVAEAERRGRVFLMGHSLGGWFAESYAAFRFEDGVSGFEELAGVVLVDGVRNDVPLGEGRYVDEGTSASGVDVAGLSGIRASTRLLDEPGVTGSAWQDVLALRARLRPEEVLADEERNAFLAPSLNLEPSAVPAMSHAAALGFLYDDQFLPNFALHVGLGVATGGPLEQYTASTPFGVKVNALRPTDPSATYTWIDAADVPKKERVGIGAMSAAWTRGATNGIEWYFPARLFLDLLAVLGGAVPEGGWQAQHGLFVFDGPKNDAPFLGIAASFPGSLYDPLKNRVAPVVGPGRPHAGAARTSDLGFQVLEAAMAHTESIMALDVDNAIPEGISAFVSAHATPGTIAVTVE